MSRENIDYDEDKVIRNEKTGEVQWVNMTPEEFKAELTEREKKVTTPGRGNSYNNKARQSYMAQPNVKEFNKTFVKKALVGRPCQFDNIEYVENELVEYFELCDKTSTVPTITAIATWLHCDRDVIYYHANNPNSQFSGIFKNVINVCHTALENGAVDGKVNSVVYIFMGKNYFNLRDDKNITVSPADPNQTFNSSETMEAIQKQLASETVPNADFQEE